MYQIYTYAYKHTRAGSHDTENEATRQQDKDIMEYVYIKRIHTQTNSHTPINLRQVTIPSIHPCVAQAKQRQNMGLQVRREYICIIYGVENC